MHNPASTTVSHRMVERLRKLIDAWGGLSIPMFKVKCKSEA
jgi:hypothetical protein